MKEIFNQAEELTGTYPTGDNLRNAIHAILIRENLSGTIVPVGSNPFIWSIQHNAHVNSVASNLTLSPMILRNVEYIARTYEQNRGTTQSNPHKAFEDALASGVLTRATIGDYMYMYTDEVKGDAFKNIMTRKYIYNK